MSFCPQYFQHTVGYSLWLMCAKTSMHHTQHNRGVRSSALCTHQHVNHGNPHMGVEYFGPISATKYMPSMLGLHSFSPCYSRINKTKSIHMVSHRWFCNAANSRASYYVTPECGLVLTKWCWPGLSQPSELISVFPQTIRVTWWVSTVCKITQQIICRRLLSFYSNDEF